MVLIEAMEMNAPCNDNFPTTFFPLARANALVVKRLRKQFDDSQADSADCERHCGTEADENPSRKVAVVRG